MIVLGPLDEQRAYLSEWDYVLLRRKLDELLAAGRIRKREVLKPLKEVRAKAKNLGKIRRARLD